MNDRPILNSLSRAEEVRAGRRFAFGDNWAHFLKVIDGGRIEQAKASLRTMLGVETLAGKTFLDVGSGSGLFLLAARMLVSRVHSFDSDLRSVACTAELKGRYFSDDPDWQVERGSAVEADYLNRIGLFDVV
jgi:ribosomal protein L11 methylase PrmA